MFQKKLVRQAVVGMHGLNPAPLIVQGLTLQSESKEPPTLPNGTTPFCLAEKTRAL